MLKKLTKYIAAPGLYMFLMAVVFALYSEFWRLALLIKCNDLAATVPFSVLIKSFYHGFRFDWRVACIIMAPIYLIAFLPGIDITRREVTRIIVVGLMSIIAAVAFFLHLMDIEFFAFFNTRLNGSALLWSDTPGDVVAFVWQTYPVVRYLLLLLVVLATFVSLAVWLLNKIRKGGGKAKWWLNLAWFPVMVVIFTFGIIGRSFEIAPMRWGLAYFSEYDFANQLTLNPVYTFARDVAYDAGNREHIRKFVDSFAQPDAEKIVHNMLGAPPPDTTDPDERMIRHVKFAEQNPDPPNVIVIINESFAASLIGCLRSQYPYDLTPGFDSVAKHGILFTNFYSAGTHTCSGLFNTFTGSPHLFGKTLMKGVQGHFNYYSLPEILRDMGYSTSFFTTQDAQFDNMNGFVKSNGVMDVYSIFDYGSEDAMSWLGVPDHEMFDFAYNKLREKVRQGKFFATLLTGSHHGPWYYPDMPFNPLPDSIDRAKEFNSLKYADWALARFISKVASDSLFKNTLFVVTADNGYKYDVTVDLDISLLEIPLLLYNTSWHLDHGIRDDRLGSQLDILSTVMGQVGRDYDNYSFGVDLLDSTAAVTDFVLTTRWYQVGYIEDSCYLVTRLDGGPVSLFRLDDKHHDIAKKEPRTVRELLSHAHAVYEAAFRNPQRPLAEGKSTNP